MVKRKPLTQHIAEQRKDIEECERNGVSYAGENGPAIRQADLDYLARFEKALATGYKFLPKDFFTNKSKYS